MTRNHFFLESVIAVNTDIRFGLDWKDSRGVQRVSWRCYSLSYQCCWHVMCILKIYNGARWTTQDGYLDPAADRPNLRIIPNAMVFKVSALELCPCYGLHRVFCTRHLDQHKSRYESGRVDHFSRRNSRTTSKCSGSNHDSDSWNYRVRRNIQFATTFNAFGSWTSGVFLCLCFVVLLDETSIVPSDYVRGESGVPRTSLNPRDHTRTEPERLEHTPFTRAGVGEGVRRCGRYLTTFVIVVSVLVPKNLKLGASV